MIKFIKPAVIIITILLSTSNIFALEVDIDELKSTKKIIFENYRGRYRKGDPVYKIRAIGKGLATGVKRRGSNRKFQAYMKYSIVHAVSKKEPKKLSADIFSIDRRAKVTHITNIRRILSAYLESMYKYSKKDAWTLAVFVTYYNAAYRGNLKYFSSKYKIVVTRLMNKKNAGLSTKYHRWPGRTKIVIPLTEQSKRGKIDTINTDIISDKKIRDKMRKDDKNIIHRKGMVDLKKKIIKKEKKEIKKRKEKLITRKKGIKKEEKRIKERKKDIKKEKERVKKIKDPKKRKEEEKRIIKKEKEIKKKEEGLDRTKKTIKKEEKEIKKEEKKIEEKTEKLEEEKKEIEKDEIKRDVKKDPGKAKEKLEKKSKELEEKEKRLEEREKTIKDKKPSKNIFGDKLYYLKINEWKKNGHYNNEMFMINAASRKILFKSPVTNIAGRKYDVFSDGVVVITHLGDYTSNHRLTLLDRDTLNAKILGTDSIFWRSFVEIKHGHIFVIIIEKNNYYLGKFDENLKLVAKSGEKVNMNSFITFYGDYIYINRWDRRIIVLKLSDLSLIDVIKPE